MKLFLAIVSLGRMGFLVVPLLQNPQWEWTGVQNIALPELSGDAESMSAWETTLYQAKVKGEELWSELAGVVRDGADSLSSKTNQLIQGGDSSGSSGVGIPNAGRSVSGGAGGAAGNIGGAIGGN